mmetsp:Transcript_31443/g.83753  ORF Transcript_31443/g.83753 Transcript_31443/m.83753 type:complete len:315 (-) Transcript_31443:89-1033(-)
MPLGRPAHEGFTPRETLLTSHNTYLYISLADEKVSKCQLQRRLKTDRSQLTLLSFFWILASQLLSSATCLQFLAEEDFQTERGGLRPARKLLHSRSLRCSPTGFFGDSGVDLGEPTRSGMPRETNSGASALIGVLFSGKATSEDLFSSGTRVVIDSALPLFVRTTCICVTCGGSCVSVYFAFQTKRSHTVFFRTSICLSFCSINFRISLSAFGSFAPSSGTLELSQRDSGCLPHAVLASFTSVSVSNAKRASKSTSTGGIRVSFAWVRVISSSLESSEWRLKLELFELFLVNFTLLPVCVGSSSVGTLAAMSNT